MGSLLHGNPEGEKGAGKGGRKASGNLQEMEDRRLAN
jgi:hypothetical protein